MKGELEGVILTAGLLLGQIRKVVEVSYEDMDLRQAGSSALGIEASTKGLAAARCFGGPMKTKGDGIQEIVMRVAVGNESAWGTFEGGWAKGANT